MARSKYDIIIELKSALDGLERAVDGLDRLDHESDEAAAGVRKVGNETERLSQRAPGLFKRFGDSMKQGLSFAIGNKLLETLQRIPAAMTGAIQRGIAFNATLETTEMRFRALLGSAGAARERVQDLVDFAATTPFELPDVLETNVLLENLTSGFLSTAEGMKLVGDAAAITGRPLSEVSMWIGRLYGGLQNGTPIGEATLRLLEMGVVTGDVKRELDALAAQGLVGPEAWEKAEAALMKFEGAMVEMGGTWNQLVSNMSDSLNQNLATALEPVFVRLRAGLDAALGSEAMGDMAEGIASALEIGFQAVTDGTLIDLMMLATEAVVERGGQALNDMLAKVADGLGSPDFWVKVLDGVMTFGVGMTKILIKAFRIPIDWFQARLVVIASKIDVLVEKVRTLGRSSREAATMEEALAAVREMNDEGTDNLVNFLTASLDISKEFIGTAKEGAEAKREEASAWQQFIDKINAATAARKAEKEAGAAGDGEKGAPGAPAAPVTYNGAIIKRQREELSELRRERAAMEADFSITEAQKYARRDDYLRREAEVLTEIIELLEEKKAAASGDTAATIQQDIESFTKERDQIVAGRAGAGPDPNSMGEQVTAGVTDMFDTMGTEAQNAAELVAAPFQGAFQGIQGSLQGLIDGTMTWGQALRNIGTTIVNGVIGAFSKMVAQWITKRLMMFAFNRKLDAADTAANAAKNAQIAAQEAAAAGTTAAAWTPAAMLKSIATFGAAALIGAALLAAVMGGFKEGGYTGDGPEDAVAGFVHRGEVVIPARTVRAAGGPAAFAPLLNGFRAEGRAGIGASGPSMADSLATRGAESDSGAVAGLGVKSLNIGVFDDRTALRGFLQTSEGESAVMDIMRRNRHEFGLI